MQNMDYHKVLRVLTTNDKQDVKGFDEKLGQILQKTFSLIPEEIKDDMKYKITSNGKEGKESSARWQYLCTLLYVLNSLRKNELANSNTFLSVSQYRTVKVALEMATSIGIMPCLLPGVGVNMLKLCPHAAQLPHEELTELQAYERLTSTVRTFIDCFNEITLRPAIIMHLGPLIAALLQLSYAPLMKPVEENPSSETGKPADASRFKMTAALYQKLMKDREEFRMRLDTLVENCPQSAVMKEFIVILGMKNAPKWIGRQSQKYLVDRIIQSNGVVALMLAVSEDIFDIDIHWEKLDTVARLIATPQGHDPEKYYDSVCSQIIEILNAKDFKHSTIIANCCIAALYDCDPTVCVERVVRVIMRPLLTNVDKLKAADVKRDEEAITLCIENLAKCFTTDERFKSLPCKTIAEVAIPLFRLYTKARRSPSSLRNKVKQLLILLLSDEELRDDLYSAFLREDDAENDVNFGQRLSFTFGPSGGFEISETEEPVELEELAGSLFDLVHSEKTLSYGFFCYLLKSMSALRKTNIAGQRNRLETSDDLIDRVKRRVVVVELLSQLAETATVQEAQIEKPEHILSFIKSLFDERSKRVDKTTSEIEEGDEEKDTEVLYIGLMLIKIILMDETRPKDWKLFDDFATFLNEQLGTIPEQSGLFVIIQEIVSLVKMHGTSARKHYYDLSADNRGPSEFKKAFKDLCDPLLPVRAHGLISLTKLVESKDPETIVKKDIAFCFFRENLKHEDSFVYLAAVNGLCALAMQFPQKVIEILVQEYIDMPQRNVDGGISAESRAKLGEILVKVTKALGEMAPSYKNVLINGFLCGTRDHDPLVRTSSLSCLGELCRVLGFRLGNIITEVLYCIGCIIKTDKAAECRRAGVLVATLLLRGLGKAALTSLGSDLVELYRGLIYLRNNDDDSVLRLHAQLALEEFDDIVRNFLFARPALEKNRVKL